MTYFGEREEGERPRENSEITEAAWGGIQALIRARIADGSFGASYCETCYDGGSPVGTCDPADQTDFKAHDLNMPQSASRMMICELADWQAFTTSPTMWSYHRAPGWSHLASISRPRCPMRVAMVN